MMSHKLTVKDIPDDQLSMKNLLLKHQDSFINYFLPTFIEGISGVWVDYDKKTYTIMGRVKIHHQSSKGKLREYKIDAKRYQRWHDNIKLFEFVGSKL